MDERIGNAGHAQPQPTPEASRAARSEPAIDPARAEHALNALRSEQNLPLAIAAGIISALLGAAAWAAITVLTGYQIGFMAIGVGVVVGLAVRAMGKGIDKPFGLVGAGFSVLGCALGNLLAVCGILSAQDGVPYFQVLGSLDFAMARNLMVMTFSPIDLLFYGLAVFYGHRFSFRQVTGQEIETPSPELRPGTAR